MCYYSYVTFHDDGAPAAETAQLQCTMNEPCTYPKWNEESSKLHSTSLG